MTTILGRRRQLPDAALSRNRAAQSHALRAAINTPIQGSAADIATAAMLRINEDEALQSMGWRLLLQVGVDTSVGARLGLAWPGLGLWGRLWRAGGHRSSSLPPHWASQSHPLAPLMPPMRRCTTR